jgi:hypothetical protein
MERVATVTQHQHIHFIVHRSSFVAGGRLRLQTFKSDHSKSAARRNSNNRRANMIARKQPGDGICS